jgi:hypothetical protein
MKRSGRNDGSQLTFFAVSDDVREAEPEASKQVSDALFHL